MGYIRNAVLIDAPLEEVFRLTNDVRTWPDLFTEYAASEVLEEDADSVTFRLTTHPNEQNQQWSWIARRSTDRTRHSTYSERNPPAPPFARMQIRWWYDQVGPHQTVMTWEQEFTLNDDAPVSDEQATAYLNKQTKVQQQAIREKLERLYATPKSSSGKPLYRGVIIGRYHPGSEEQLADAFRRSDATELPQLIGVQSRHIWVLGGVEVHFIEAAQPLPEIIREYFDHPLFQAIKAEADQYVFPLAPGLVPGVGKEIYHWFQAENQGVSAQ